MVGSCRNNEDFFTIRIRRNHRTCSECMSQNNNKESQKSWYMQRLQTVLILQQSGSGFGDFLARNIITVAQFPGIEALTIVIGLLEFPAGAGTYS